MLKEKKYVLIFIMERRESHYKLIYNDFNTPSIIYDNSPAVDIATSPATTSVVSPAKSYVTSEHGYFPYGKIP